MRITCPNCGAQYEVDEALIPETGRDVQCSNCGKGWFQTKTVDEEPEAAAEEVAPREPAAGALESADEDAAEPEVAEAAGEPDSTAEASEPPEAEDAEELQEPEVVADGGPADHETEASDEDAGEDALEDAIDAPPEEVSVAPPTEAEAEAEDVVAEAAYPEDDEAAAEDLESAIEAEADWHKTDEDVPIPDEAQAEPEETAPVPDEPDDEAETGLPPGAPPPRAPEEAVLSILREEADREMAARRAEASTGLESQPDLGLEEGTSATAAATAGAAAVAASARRDLLPDIDEINSSLRPDAERAAEDAEVSDASARQSRSGFRTGFSMMILLAAALILLYVFAGPLAEAVPALSGLLAAYVEWANGFRAWLDGMLASGVDSLSPPAASQAAASN